MLALSPDLDIPSLAREFASRRRIRIPGILTVAAATAAAEAMEASDRWSTCVAAGGEHFELPLHDRRAADPAKQGWIDQARIEGSDPAMQFIYDTRRIAVEHETGADLDIVSRFPAFLNGAAFLDFARAVTGDDRIAHVSAQATRYRPGQALTTHDDTGLESGRLYAYVLNLTRGWNPDWGGLLLFPDEEGHIAQGFTPTFNGLNIFAVPMRHAVSQVASFAPRDRHSVTGWLRVSEAV
jgi:hypothetical protein